MSPRLRTAILIFAFIVAILLPRGSFWFHTLVDFIAIPIVFLLRALIWGRD
jgi:hypothetical protein